MFFMQKIRELEPLELQIHWKNYKEKFLEWWSKFYIDKENNRIDDKKKGFIAFNKDELQQ